MLPDAPSGWSAELARLWFEPWEHAHASWLDPTVTPPGWARQLAVNLAGARLSYFAWCRHFCIEPRPPAQLAWPHSMTLAPDRLEVCALRVGMLACASDPAFARQWLSDRASALAAAPSAWWREAARWARARPLRMPGSPTTRISHASLVATGLAAMRHAALALQPQLWSRLQFRCDRRLLEVIAAGTLDDASCRQVRRIWILVSTAQEQIPNA